MNSFHVKAQLCPKCGYLLDACTAVDGTKGPKPGDVTVCIGCAQVLEYLDGLDIAVMDKDELPEEVWGVIDRVVSAVLMVKATQS